MEQNLEELSLSELKELRKNVEAAIVGYQDREKAKARAVLEEKAKELGFGSLEEIVGKKARRAKAAIKYRHPENPSLTWSGRGRRPKWIEEALANGGSLDDFKID